MKIAIIFVLLLLLSGCKEEGIVLIENENPYYKGSDLIINPDADDLMVSPINLSFFNIQIECTDTPVYLNYKDYEVKTTLKNICDVLGRMKEVKR